MKKKRRISVSKIEFADGEAYAYTTGRGDEKIKIIRIPPAVVEDMGPVKYQVYHRLEKRRNRYYWVRGSNWERVHGNLANNLEILSNELIS